MSLDALLFFFFLNAALSFEKSEAFFTLGFGQTFSTSFSTHNGHGHSDLLSSEDSSSGISLPELSDTETFDESSEEEDSMLSCLVTPLLVLGVECSDPDRILFFP